MTNRTTSVLLLFVASVLVGAVLAALGVATAVQIGQRPRGWLVSATLLLSAIAVFFGGRRYVLPTHIANAPAKALFVTGGWLGGTMVAAGGIVWAARAVLPGPLSGVFGLIPIWLALILVCGSALQKRAALP